MTSTGPTDALQMQHLANQVHDHSTVLQALQIDMRHAVKLLDKLVVVADKQSELGHELSRHNDSFTRVFTDMREMDSKQATAINSLTDELKIHREQTAGVAETVTGYKASIRTIMMIGASVVSLLSIIGLMFASSVTREQLRTAQDISAVNTRLDNRIIATDAKIDTLSRDLQELRLRNENPR